jgi:uncharacterized protein
VAPRQKASPSTPKLIAWGAALLAMGLVLGQALSHVGCDRKSNRAKPEDHGHPSKGGSVKPEASKPGDATSGTSTKPSSTEHGPNARTPEPDEAPRPRFALIIDDFGYAEIPLVERLLKQSTPFSVAVLPYQEHTKESADLAHRAGKEVMLHLPMEGRAEKNPGPDALLFDLNEAELRARTRKALGDVPFISGANNHMGSRITADQARMNWILEEFKGRQLFFVDSRTTKDTVAFDTAKRLGLRAASRQVFLDDDKSFVEIEKQWNRALKLAGKDGQVVVIGHIYPETVEALEKLVPKAKDKVKFVKAGELAQ